MGLVAALIAFSPVASRAANIPVDSDAEQVAPGTVQECPLKQSATPSDCGSGGTGELAASGVVTRETRIGPKESPEQNDAYGTLLKDLVAHGTNTDEEGL